MIPKYFAGGRPWSVPWLYLYLMPVVAAAMWTLLQQGSSAPWKWGRRHKLGCNKSLQRGIIYPSKKIQNMGTSVNAGVSFGLEIVHLLENHLMKDVIVWKLLTLNFPFYMRDFSWASSSSYHCWVNPDSRNVIWASIKVAWILQILQNSFMQVLVGVLVTITLSLA